VRLSVLKKRFPDVMRVGDAAEALCLIEEPDFSSRLGLVITGHQWPGLGCPAFVAELHTRVPAVPVLVLGNGNDAEGDYSGDRVRFLPRPAAAAELVAAASQMLMQDGH